MLIYVKTGGSRACEEYARETYYSVDLRKAGVCVKRVVSRYCKYGH